VSIFLFDRLSIDVRSNRALTWRMLLVFQRLRLAQFRTAYSSRLRLSRSLATRRFAFAFKMPVSSVSSPLTSDAGTPEPPPMDTEAHPAAWQDNLEEDPTIVRPKGKAQSPVKEATSPETRPGRKRRKTAPAELDGLEDAPSQQLTKSTRKRRRVGRESATPKDEPDTSSPPLAGELLTQPKKRATPRKRKTVGGDEGRLVKIDEDAEQYEEPPKPRRKRKSKVVEPVVYDIPPVERKITTFRGRLGYVSIDFYIATSSVFTLFQACLNTILRKAKPDPIFCSR
jgi:hypothetical protein